MADVLDDILKQLTKTADAAQKWAWPEMQYPSSLKTVKSDEMYDIPNEITTVLDLNETEFERMYMATLARVLTHTADHDQLDLFGRIMLLHRSALGYTSTSGGHPMQWMLGVVRWVLGDQVPPARRKHTPAYPPARVLARPRALLRLCPCVRWRAGLRARVVRSGVFWGVSRRESPSRGFPVGVWFPIPYAALA